MKEKDWFIYLRISPIDWGWEHLKGVGETNHFIQNSSEIRGSLGDDIKYLESYSKELLISWEFIKNIAKLRGWEGDFRQGPVVFWIPDDYEFSYGFVWKQDNNGATYIASPERLPWLEKFTSDAVVEVIERKKE